MTNELLITRGDTVTLNVTVDDNGSAFDLTGYTCYLTIKENKNDSNANALISSLGDIISAVSGRVDFELLESDTAILSEGTFYYDVQISNGANTYTVINDIVNVNLDVRK